MHLVTAKGILSAQNGMNLYRGCTHGCIYCDSRSKCYQMHHAFEDIEVKENALALLEDALRRRRRPCMIGTGAMTDPYIPLELERKTMQGALRLIEQYGFGVAVQTKSDRVLRDAELLRAIHQKTKCVVQMTLTTFDERLCRIVEPNVCTTRQRFAALMELRRLGVPTVVWLSPLLPFLNDTEENIAGILSLCAEAGVWGVLCFGIGLTLREGNREYFYQQLDRSFPGLKERYARAYGSSYEAASPRNAELMRFFHETCAGYGIVHDNARIFQFLHTFEEKTDAEQLSLWT